MSWHYRMRKRILEGEPWFDIVEYYPNAKKGGWTVDSVTPEGQTPKEVLDILKRMLADVERFPLLVDTEE